MIVERRRLVAERDRLRREDARRRRRRAVRRNRIVVATVAAVVAGLSWTGVDLVSAVGASRPSLRTPVAPRVVEGPRVVVPGHLAALPWPSAGEGAVAVVGSGLVAASPDHAEVPIASMTKMMTAYIVLADHRLRPGQQGPSVTFSARDVAAWVRASQSDDSNVPVQAGERLTLYQLLEGLLIPSGDNIADFLARWDAGSVRAFVAKMNATAAALKLTDTHYADASGVSPGSRSDAADQALLASIVMENPVVRSIVARPSVAFPVAGTIWNYNPALGVDGIIGVKSGFTSAALGCLATAAYENVDGHSALVVAVSTGQPDGLYGAARVDEALLKATAPQLLPFRPLGFSRSVGSFAGPGSAPRPLRLAADPPVVVAWPGLSLREQVVIPAADPTRPKAPAGELLLSSRRALIAQLPLVPAPTRPA